MHAWSYVGTLSAICKLAAEDSACYNFYCLQVAKPLSSIIRDGFNSESDVSLIDFMHDPQRIAAYKQLQETVENLRKAHATLRKL